jgi:hypothetical protein
VDIETVAGGMLPCHIKAIAAHCFKRAPPDDPTQANAPAIASAREGSTALRNPLQPKACFAYREGSPRRTMRALLISYTAGMLSRPGRKKNANATGRLSLKRQGRFARP